MTPVRTVTTAVGGGMPPIFAVIATDTAVWRILAPITGLFGCGPSVRVTANRQNRSEHKTLRGAPR
jgi:hypothetical protein